MMRRFTSAPKPRRASGRTSRAAIARVGARVAVAHAVVAREVRARLGGRDEVVDRDRERGVRQRDVDELAPRAAQLVERRVERRADVGVDALVEQRARHADAQRRAMSPVERRRRSRAPASAARRRVARIVPGDHAEQRAPRRAPVARTGRSDRATTRRRSGRSATRGRRSASGRRRRRAPRAGGSIRRCRTRARAAPCPAATAAADPPLDPPGMRSSAHGLRVGPNAEFSVDEPIANSSQLVLPTIDRAGALRAARRRWRRRAARSARACATPAVVGMPRVQMLSLSAIGTPSSGASAGRLARRAAAARASARSRVDVQKRVQRGSSRRRCGRARRGRPRRRRRRAAAHGGADLAGAPMAGS